eukprot:4942218-Amphidinium_carterae.1
MRALVPTNQQRKVFQSVHGLHPLLGSNNMHPLRLSADTHSARKCTGTGAQGPNTTAQAPGMGGWGQGAPKSGASALSRLLAPLPQGSRRRTACTCTCTRVCSLSKCKQTHQLEPRKGHADSQSSASMIKF